MNNTTIKTVLGFDFGMKRIGVAVGQTVTHSARPLETLQAHQGIPSWPKLDKIIKVWQPDALVVGIPLNMDGTPQPLTLAVHAFSKSLMQRYKLSVYGVDERLSTKDARERLFQQGGYKALQHGQVDSMAAQLILQNWLSQFEQDNK